MPVAHTQEEYINRIIPYRMTTRASTPCSENTFFAKSIPTVVTLAHKTSPSRLRLNTHFNLGTPMPRHAGEVTYIR
jgi:hypothetical protein